MARAEQPKLYRSFVKGLITEASFLTYPEDSSIDELNTVLSRKGNRTRRFGIDYEEDYTLLSIPVGDSDAVSEYVWRSANSNANANFLCVQVGLVIHFFSLEGTPISDSQKSFTVNLSSFAAPGASDLQISTTPCGFAGGKGYLFVVNPYCEPVIVEYKEETDTIESVPVIIQIRDFEGVNDGLANDEEPTTLSNEHKYNLMNQGWVTPGYYSVPGGVTVDTDRIFYDPYSGGGRFYDNDIR